MILKLQNAGKFKTTSGSGYIPPSINVTPSKKLPTAATVGQWLKGTFSYITGIKDSDLIESKYRPSKETDTTTKYYTRKGLDYDVMRNLLGGKESLAKTFEGKPLYYKNFNDLYNRLSNRTYRKGRLLRITDNSQLGEYTIGIGEDKNGRYVSYYDKFDWAPNEKLEIFFPYEIYNRIYEKDFNRMLKELNNETYSGSNPSGNWFFKSGVNNKGYFKFGGKTANARKWKHQEGCKMIKKAEEGAKFNTGLFLLNAAGQLYNGIKNANDSIKFNESLDAGVKSIKSNINMNEVKRKSEEVLNSWRELNPDVHYSDIDLALIQLKFINDLMLSNELEAQKWRALLLAKYNNSMNAIKGFNLENTFETLSPLLSKYLGNTTSTTETIV